MSLIADKIYELIEPTISEMGYELWGVEYINTTTPTLRIYIDIEDGINIEDCSDVSREVSSILDVEDPIEAEYNLEVSSPGYYRPFFTLEQMQKYIGENITIQLRVAQYNRRKWFGKLLEITENSFVLDTSVTKEKIKPGKANKKANTTTVKPVIEKEYDPIVKFLFSNVMKANLEPEF